MRELPILMNGAMVRAVLEGRKTVTRRLVTPQPQACDHLAFERHEGHIVPTRWVTDATGEWYCATCGNGMELCHAPQGFRGIRSPYGKPGDRLYVRETYFGNHYLHPHEPADERELHYRADGYEDFEGEKIVWRPGIHMPKWAARIWLDVTAVRVERLQDISPEQAAAEGATAWASEQDNPIRDLNSGDERIAFMALWDGLAKPGTSWGDNPWVWVVEFRRVEYRPEPVTTEKRECPMPTEVPHGG